MPRSVAKKSSKQSTKKKTNTKKTTAVPAKTSIGPWWRRLSWRGVAAASALPFVRLYRRLRRQRATATHKSFVLTRRRDMPKAPQLESYWKFPLSIFALLWQAKRLFAPYLLVYTLAGIVLFGAVQGNGIRTINETIDTLSTSEGIEFGAIERAATVVTTSLAGSLNTGLSEIQQLYMSGLYIFAALVVIWLLRFILAGKSVRLRDGIYNAGAPIIPILLLLIVGLLQAVPAAVAILLYINATAAGLLSGGIETAIFTAALALIVILTLYFMTTTLFALMIASVQGTYPFKAYVAAKKVILGQRRRVLFRLLWMSAVIIALWFVVLVPVSVIAQATSLQNSAVIPVAVQFVTGLSILYGATYSYLLYREMIDEPTH